MVDSEEMSGGYDNALRAYEESGANAGTPTVPSDLAGSRDGRPTHAQAMRRLGLGSREAAIAAGYLIVEG